MKKAISLFLALMLCVGILAVPAFAEDFTVKEGDLTVSLTNVKETKTLRMFDSETGEYYNVTACVIPATGSTAVITAPVGTYLVSVIPGLYQKNDVFGAYKRYGGFDALPDYNGDGETELTGTLNLDAEFFKNEYSNEYSVDPTAYLLSIDVFSYGTSGFSGWCRVYFAFEGSEPAAPAKPVVQVSPQKVTLDGKSVEPEHYNIDGENYFKLRDLASLLNGTAAQFEVGYNDATKTISVTTGKAYTPNGDEMIVGVDQSASAVVSAQSIEINGTAQNLTAYNIGGNNFFRLRDLNELIGYGVDYDAATNTAVITTK